MISSEDDYVTFFKKYGGELKKRLWVGFNNTHFDTYILELIFRNLNKPNLTSILYNATQDIIAHNEWGGKVLMKYSSGDKRTSTFQLDLMSFDSQRLSLKEFGVRIHHDKLQTLPFNPTKELHFLDFDTIVDYCINDVKITKKLHDTVFKEDVEVKEHLVNTFKLPNYFYSKSNRAITEHILCDNTLKPFRKEFRYQFPYDFNFKTEEFQWLKHTFENIDFDDDVSFSESIDIDDMKLDFGLGGIHGVIKNYQGKDLIDIDVASYYPNLIRNLQALPQTVADPQAFYDMIDERVELKKTDKAKATAYKIVINTVYGAMNYKFGNKLGMLYDLENLYKVTITGQLLIAKLIEDLVSEGYKVVYANTDGIMIENKGDTKYKEICNKWEKQFNLVLEYATIKKAYIKDVNNFILVDDKGKLKVKGAYNNGLGTRQSCFANIANKALLNYIQHETPLEETVMNGTDVKDYLLYHKFSSQYVNTEIIDRDTHEKKEFHRVLRYFLSKDANNYIMALNSNTGSHIRKERTSNVVPIWELKNKLPHSIDYDQYIEMAYDKLGDLTGEEVEYNPYIKDIIERLEVAL